VAVLTEFDANPAAPILWATAAVVPEPRNESRTQSPGFVAISMTRLMSSSGFFPFGT
jgi:hypothetical protein